MWFYYIIVQIYKKINYVDKNIMLKKQKRQPFLTAFIFLFLNKSFYYPH